MSSEGAWRIACVVAALLAGALIGWMAGGFWGRQALTAAGFAAAALLILIEYDSRRADRVMAWLRAPRTLQMPQGTGFWGELGYRIERQADGADKALREERARRLDFLAAIEASPNGVLLLDANELIVWCNAVAAEHFGLHSERDLQQRVTNLLRAPAFVAHLQAREFDEPVVFPGPLGLRTLSVLIRRYGDGQMLVLSHDITERERAEAMRRDFVANVSHEIRTPLTVIAGFVETLTDLPLSADEQKRVLALMAQQTGRMQALVGDLLALAQLEGSPPPAPDRWIRLDTVLNRAFKEAQALSAQKHDLHMIAPEGLEVAGSERELHSAISNLLNNAVRYTPAGGRVELNVQLNEDGSLTVAVRDTGIGIASEHLPRLHERFYRVDGSRSRDTGGTGLGLSIVKHVAQRHGGEVSVDSEPGLGSRFVLTLPPMRVRRATTPVKSEPSSGKVDPVPRAAHTIAAVQTDQDGALAED